MLWIALVRHGETDWNCTGRMQGRSDIPMNKMGIAQMEACGAALQAGSWQAVATSPLSRALQSGKILAKALGVPLYPPVAGLTEQDYGEATGLTAEERRSRYPDGKCQGLESVEAMAERMLQSLLFLAEHAQEKGGGNLVVVSHGSAINAVLRSLDPACFENGATASNGKAALLLYDNRAFTICGSNLSPVEALRVLKKENRDGSYS